MIFRIYKNLFDQDILVFDQDILDKMPIYSDVRKNVVKIFVNENNSNDRKRFFDKLREQAEDVEYEEIQG